LKSFKLSPLTCIARIAILLTALNASVTCPSYAASTEAIALNNAGVDALTAKDYRVALEKFLEALQLEPGYTVARENLGVTLSNIGIQKPLEEALPYFHRSLYVSPGAPNVLRNLQSAIDALNMDPAKFEDRVKLADQALASKDYAGAIVEYDAALKIRDDAQVRRKLSTVPKPVDLPSQGEDVFGSGTSVSDSSKSTAAHTVSPSAVQQATTIPSSIPTGSVSQPGAAESPASTVNQASSSSPAASGAQSELASAVPANPQASQSAVTAPPADQATFETLSRMSIMDLNQARQYLFGLINKDRLANGLNAVQMDEIATTAGQMQTDDEAEKHYMSHWNTQGKKPPQRYTEAGGSDYVAENASGATSLPDGFALSQPQLFERSALDGCHARMMGEVPPNDGHRRNILDPAHTHVGLGLTSVQHAQYAHKVAYVAEEFINRRGTYSALPNELKRGTAVEFKGTFDPGYKLQSIQIKSEPLPRPAKPPGGGYTLPEALVDNIFPGKMPEPGASSVTVDGQNFTCTLNVGESWKPGLYYVLIWVYGQDQNEPVPVSLRAIPLYK
jgi:uncharacterized protein YkwD